MTIKQILEEVEGIRFANGKVNGIGWIDAPRLEQQEHRIKQIIKQKIIKILREKEGFWAGLASDIANDIIKDL